MCHNHIERLRDLFPRWTPTTIGEALCNTCSQYYHLQTMQLEELLQQSTHLPLQLHQHAQLPPSIATKGLSMLDPSYLPLNQHYHVIMQIMIDYSFLDSVVKRNLLPTRIPLAHHSCDCVEDHIGDISHENITKIDYDFPCGS